MERHTNAEPGARRHVIRQATLRFERRGNTLGRPGEHREHAVAFAARLEDHAAEPVDHVGEQLVVLRQGACHHARVGVPERGRVLHVGQQECHDPTR